jgi:hypothetical protein
MVTSIRRHFTYANLVATLALLVVLSMHPAVAHVGTSFRHLWGQHIKPKVAHHVRGYEIVEDVQQLSPNQTYANNVNCPRGKKPLSGGVVVESTGADDAQIHMSGPSGDTFAIPSLQRWLTVVTYTGTSIQPGHFYAICATAPVTVP